MRRCGIGLGLLLGVVLLLAAGCGSGEVPPPATEAPTDTQESALPEPAPSSPAAWSSSELKSASLTRTFKTQSEYTCTIKLTIWEPIPKSVDSLVTHPESDEAVIDPASDYDPAMDAVIPFAMKLTNTTKGFDLEEPGIRYSLTEPKARAGVSASEIVELGEARVLEAWAWYADGVDVTTWDLRSGRVSLENGNENAQPSVTWSEPLATGDSVTQYGYFVYRDHRTPAEPKGSKWALDFVVVMPNYTGAFASGPTSTKGLSLTGAVEDTVMAW